MSRDDRSWMTPETRAKEEKYSSTSVHTARTAIAVTTATLNSSFDESLTEIDSLIASRKMELHIRQNRGNDANMPL